MTSLLTATMLWLFIFLNPFTLYALDSQCSGYGSNGKPLCDVSLIRLISTPSQYEAQLIRAKGFLSLEHEGTAIYLSESDRDHGIYQNAVWLSIDENSKGIFIKDKMDSKYVSIVGRYTGKRHGHLSLFSGEIFEISDVSVISVRSK